jgi:hypothetical protein
LHSIWREGGKEGIALIRDGTDTDTDTDRDTDMDKDICVADTLDVVIDPIPRVLAAVGEGVRASAVSPVLLPFAHIDVPVLVVVAALSLGEVLLELSVVEVAVGEVVPTDAILSACAPLPDVPITLRRDVYPGPLQERERERE